MEPMDFAPESGMPPCRGQHPGALRRYAVACRSSALVAGRAGKHELATRLFDLADQVEQAVSDSLRANWAAAA